MPARVTLLEMQPQVVGSHCADGWRVAMLRAGEVMAELEPYQARALAVELVRMADVVGDRQGENAECAAP